MPAWQRLVEAACIGLALIVLHGVTVRYDSYQGRFEPYFMVRQWLYQRYYKSHELFLGISALPTAALFSFPRCEPRQHHLLSSTVTVAAVLFRLRSLP